MRLGSFLQTSGIAPPRWQRAFGTPVMVIVVAGSGEGPDSKKPPELAAYLSAHLWQAPHTMNSPPDFSQSMRY
jgi:hypothetical protein